ADDVQRVVVVVVTVYQVAGLDPDLEGALFIPAERVLRELQVALAVRRVLEVLTRRLAHITRRRTDVAAIDRLDEQELSVRNFLDRGTAIGRFTVRPVFALVPDDLVDDSLRDHQVIARPKLQGSQHRVADAGSMVDEEA